MDILPAIARQISLANAAAVRPLGVFGPNVVGNIGANQRRGNQFPAREGLAADLAGAGGGFGVAHGCSRSGISCRVTPEFASTWR